MILLAPPELRDKRHDYLLGGFTAAAAGLVNVCSVIAFFAFASNVTGHFAVLSEELVKGHWHQIGAVGGWLVAFITGAFVANLLVTTIGLHSPRFGRGLVLGLEIATLMGVGYYGQFHYRETLSETEYLVGVLLFAMGLQNSLVATVSKGVVKTTHLTGLLTDLGMELSMIAQRRFARDLELKFKLWLHVVILVAYVFGGIFGGFLFLQFGFITFHVGGALLGAIVVLDLLPSKISALAPERALWGQGASRGMEPRAAKRADVVRKIA